MTASQTTLEAGDKPDGKRRISKAWAAIQLTTTLTIVWLEVVIFIALGLAVFWGFFLAPIVLSVAEGYRQMLAKNITDSITHIIRIAWRFHTADTWRHPHRS